MTLFRRILCTLIALQCIVCTRFEGHRDTPSLQDEVGTDGATAAGRCSPLNYAAVGADADRKGEQPAYIDRIVPRPVAEIADTVLYAIDVDVDCDGVPDFVGYVRLRHSTGSGSQNAFVVYRNKGGGIWTQLLVAPSVVDGLERLVIAADLTRSSRRDIVTLGIDEGGYVPRAFYWKDGTLLPVVIPATYTLRNEESWDAACLARINPRAISEQHVVLLRETINPEATMGHGADCALPADTLQIRRDSLVPARDYMSHHSRQEPGSG